MAAISEKLKRDMEAQFGGSRTLEGGPKVPYFKVDGDGENHAFRVLPGEFGESKELWFLGVAQHWVKKGVNRVPYYCPRIEDSPCPFCDKLDEYREEEKNLKEQLKSREVKADKAKYKKLEAELKLIAKINFYVAPRSSYLINVLDREAKDVKVFSAPKTVFSKIMGYYSEDGPTIFDTETGHDFRIKKKKKGRATEYTLELAPKETALGPTASAIQDILDKRHNLEALIKFEEKEKLVEACEDGISSILSGVGDDDGPEEEDHGHGHEEGGERDDRDRSRDDDDRPRRSREEDDDRPSRRSTSDDDDRPSRRSSDDDSPARGSRDEDDRPRRSREDDEPEKGRVDLSGAKKSSALLSRMNRLKDDE